MTRYVRIDYKIKPDVELGDVMDAISEFVAWIASHHADRRYTSLQCASDPRHFVHIAEIVEEVLEDFQAMPFFRKFSPSLRERCSGSPEVTLLTRVASTR